MALDPVSAAFDIGGKIIDRLWPDPAQAAQARMQLIQMYQNGDLAQLKVNEAEAASASVFVSGWRPFIGWVCGAALLFQYVARPIAMAIEPGIDLPALDNTLWELMFGMLGMGALRSYDKRLGNDTQAVAVPFAKPAPRQMPVAIGGQIVSNG